jgi:DNA replication initiation complex subunit (GINS family)
MKNSERIEGLRAVQSEFDANTAEAKRLNEEMRAFLADPGEPETQPQRADEMVERLHTLHEDRKRILGRLTKVDPAFSAPMN